MIILWCKIASYLQFYIFFSLILFCISGPWWGSLMSTLRVTTLRKWLNRRYRYFLMIPSYMFCMPTNICIIFQLHSQVDQLVLEEVVRERFPKLGMFQLHSQYGRKWHIWACMTHIQLRSGADIAKICLRAQHFITWRVIDGYHFALTLVATIFQPSIQISWECRWHGWLDHGFFQFSSTCFHGKVVRFYTISWCFH